MVRVFLVTALAVCISSITVAAEQNHDKDSLQSKRVKPPYRVIYNYDSGPIFMSRGTTLPKHVNVMVDEIAAGGADALLICTNDQRTTYPSKVWQTLWEGYKPGDRSFFGDIPEDLIEARDDWVRNSAGLAEHGDYLEMALARCRHRNIAPGVSLRMNDMHDAPYPTSHLFSRFYRQHPELHLKPLPGRSWGARALNYAHPEVRQHFLALVRELAESYDIDVMELDFMRFPYYFEQEDIDQHCDDMTEFIRDVRAILDGTGRHIALIPRLASNPGAARQLGFDVQAWAREGLVDGITTGNFLTSCWDLAVEDFRELVGPDVAIYAGTMAPADRRDALPVRWLPASQEMLRGFAAGYLVAGADGINTFNYFIAHKVRSGTTEEFYAGLLEMHSLEHARSNPRIHVISSGCRLTECDMPVQVPVLIREWRERKFEMLLAAESEGAEVTVLVYFEGENSPDDLWLRINHHPGSPAVETATGPSWKNPQTTKRRSPARRARSPCSKCRGASFRMEETNCSYVRSKSAPRSWESMWMCGEVW